MYFHPLNFVRFLLALGVLLFHYGLSYFPFNLPVFKTLILHSSFRVSFFFFISGFVLALVYGPKALTFSSFLKRRLSRIAPLYLLAFIISLLVVVLVLKAGPKGLVIILHALGLQSWYPGYVLDLNFTTWSISVELFFYLCFPFLIGILRRWTPAKMMVVAVIVWLLQSVQHVLFVEKLADGSKSTEEFINAFPLWHLPTFFMGMVTARLIYHSTMEDLMKRFSFSFIIFALTAVALLIYVPNPVLRYIHNGLLAPLFALFILSLYYNQGLTGRILSSPRFSRLGDLSYGIFIFQYPLWVICRHIAGEDREQSSLFFWIYLVTVILVSYLMNRYVEKPVMKILRQQNSLAG